MAGAVAVLRGAGSTAPPDAEPPTRFFASWTRPSPDKRPALLVGVLLVVSGALLSTPALSDYFGLTRPARPVSTTVLPALGLWSVALTAAYRFRVLDRALGLDRLPTTLGHEATERRAV